MNATEIITTLGGTFALAKMCGVSPSAVSQWRYNGIPPNKLILIAVELEQKSEGKFNRKQIPNWHQIWPKLR
jgi:DNA-binding transcriptional regulator YdaS (Cro superfamily)